jgi:hypothetical protein
VGTNFDPSPIRPEQNRTVEIGAEQRDSPFFIASDSFGSRKSERVAVSHGHHGSLGRHGIQEKGTARDAAAMVRYFEDLGREALRAIEEPALHGFLDVAREQDPHSTIRQPEHEGLVVRATRAPGFCTTRLLPIARRIQDFHVDPMERNRLEPPA